MINVSDITDQIIAGSSIVVLSTATVGIIRWCRNVRKLIVFTAHMNANNGYESWRSSIDKRLTAIEIALPGVTPKPEPPSKPPLEH